MVQGFKKGRCLRIIPTPASARANLLAWLSRDNPNRIVSEKFYDITFKYVIRWVFKKKPYSPNSTRVKLPKDSGYY